MYITLDWYFKFSAFDLEVKAVVFNVVSECCILTLNRAVNQRLPAQDAPVELADVFTWYYLPTPPLGQDMTQGQFFKRSLTGLNSEFSFS